ncbi:unnamed protein product [Cylindrotheca closterium]|uniref:Peptidase M6-like domain-containing protein n=1 Tax=Cylindrotheca closterium TaxID=2856 RepID=A0AAD2G659_9STRA|nr:unnamed protein product [Cylindrotheca closterium]
MLLPTLIILGSACLQVANSIVASPNPFELFDDDGTFLGYMTVRGGDVNHWVEDKDGYSLCGVDGTTHVNDRHLITAQPKEGRREHARVHHGEKVVRSSHNTTGTGSNDTHFYYCAQTEDGNVVPNTDFPVIFTDPNQISNHTLPPHIHRTEAKAVEECGDFCKDEVTKGAGSKRRLEASPIATTGYLPNLVVTFRFADHGMRKLPTTKHLEALMNTRKALPGIAPTKGVKQVFLDNSNGQFEIHSTVTNWVTLDDKYTEAYCADNVGGLGYVLHECLHNALSKVDPTVNFTDFDPNGDGYIDSIAFLHSGYGAEHTDNMNWIWSHKWKLYKKENGERVKMEWTSGEGIKVHAFHISPALWGYYGNEIGRVGVIAHETAHFLGLVDLYDNEIGAGIGYWSLMANAWGFDRSQKYPPFLDPFSKGQLGWATFTELMEPQNGVVVTPSYGTHDYYTILKGFPVGEYLIIENRQREGYDKLISETGLLIWHIDTLKDNNREEGYPGQPGWPKNNKHYMVALLGADGTYHLEKGLNPGDAGDVFHEGGVTSLDSSVDNFPNTASYQNGTLLETGIIIKNIRSDGENMVFDICFDNTCASDEEEDNSVDESEGVLASSDEDEDNWIVDEDGWILTSSDEEEDNIASSGSSGTSTGCELVSGWRDRYTDNCAWYEENDTKGCRNEGMVKGTDGIRAWDACCHCNTEN